MSPSHRLIVRAPDGGVPGAAIFYASRSHSRHRTAPSPDPSSLSSQARYDTQSPAWTGGAHDYSSIISFSRFCAPWPQAVASPCVRMPSRGRPPCSNFTPRPFSGWPRVGDLFDDIEPSRPEAARVPSTTIRLRLSLHRRWTWRPWLRVAEYSHRRQSRPLPANARHGHRQRIHRAVNYLASSSHEDPALRHVLPAT